MTVAVFAPVALFVYNRPDHLSRVAAALAQNAGAADTPLYIFVDAPRTDSVAPQVAAVRTLARQLRGFATVQVVVQPTNLGVARSIVQGVSRLTAEHGRAIVLEDDLLPAPHFLLYMNTALEKYASEERVISIHAYSYPVRGRLPDTFFLRGADCWGWATWKRGWELFEPDGRKLLDALGQRGLTREFDLGGSYGYTQMLRDCIEGRNDSWAIRWYASAFLQDRLTLYPGSSQVQNIGADGSGMHIGNTRSFEHTRWGRRVELADIPIEESLEARCLFADYLAGLRPSFASRVMRRVRRLVAAGPR